MLQYERRVAELRALKLAEFERKKAEAEADLAKRGEQLAREEKAYEEGDINLRFFLLFSRQFY